MAWLLRKKKVSKEKKEIQVLEQVEEKIERKEIQLCERAERSFANAHLLILHALDSDSALSDEIIKSINKTEKYLLDIMT